MLATSCRASGPRRFGARAESCAADKWACGGLWSASESGWQAHVNLGGSRSVPGTGAVPVCGLKRSVPVGERCRELCPSGRRRHTQLLQPQARYNGRVQRPLAGDAYGAQTLVYRWRLAVWNLVVCCSQHVLSCWLVCVGSSTPRPCALVATGSNQNSVYLLLARLDWAAGSGFTCQWVCVWSVPP